MLTDGDINIPFQLWTIVDEINNYFLISTILQMFCLSRFVMFQKMTRFLENTVEKV
jgi:hypothetical protein